MKNEKCSEFIKKIEKLTKEEQIEWNRLKKYIELYSEDNYMLRNYLKENTEYTYDKNIKFLDKNIDLVDSFAADVKEGKVFLIKKILKNMPVYILAVQSNVDAQVIELNINGGFQEDLMFIRLLIIDKLDCTDKFIEGILNM